MILDKATLEREIPNKQFRDKLMKEIRVLQVTSDGRKVLLDSLNKKYFRLVSGKKEKKKYGVWKY